MNQDTELPLSLNPPYKTYGYLWFDDGIIMASFKNSMQWILSNNIHIGLSKKQLKVYNRESSFINQGPLIVKEKTIYYHDVVSNPQSIIRMVEEYIDSGYYIEGYWNEKAIKEKPAYQKYDFQHNYYIYGYNSVRNDFLSVGYTNLNQYTNFRFSYSEFIDSLKTYNSDVNKIILSKVNHNFVCVFEPDKVRIAINDYLNSYGRFIISNDVSMNESCGEKAINDYVELLCEIASENGLIDMRNSRLLMEYKQVFRRAISQLPELKIIESSEIDRIYKGYEIQHYLSLKYNTTRKRNEIDKLIDLLRRLVENERDFLEKTFIKTS